VSNPLLRTVQIQVMVCPKCGAHWIPRVDRPVKCPRCQKRLTRYYSCGKGTYTG